MPYMEIAKELDIEISARTLQRYFTAAGYHRRVARTQKGPRQWPQQGEEVRVGIALGELEF